jgi:hypothetical protein
MKLQSRVSKRRAVLLRAKVPPPDPLDLSNTPWAKNGISAKRTQIQDLPDWIKPNKG